MKILFWQWHSFMGKGMERALHRLNIAYDTFFYQMNDWESDDRFAEQLEKRISQQAYDAVISINFNPVISDVCQNHKLPYRAWVYDSPIHIELRSCEYVGMAKVEKSFLPLFKKRMEEMIRSQQHSAWWENVLYSFTDQKEQDIYTVDVDGKFWAEIDYFDDYERIIDYVAHTRESRK